MVFSVLKLQPEETCSLPLHYFYQRRVDIINQVESTIGYIFPPRVGYFTSPGIDTRQKGLTAFSVCQKFSSGASWIRRTSDG